MPLQTKKDQKEFILTIDDDYANMGVGGFTENPRMYYSTELAASYYGDGAVELGILPPVVRYLTPNFLGAIVERPPSMQTINFRAAGKFQKADDLFYTLPIPWCVYALAFDARFGLKHFSIFFRNTQVWTVKDKLSLPCTPNVGTGGSVCYAHDLAGRTPKCQTLAEALNMCIESYWGSIGNMNIPSFCTSHAPEYLKKKVAAREGIPQPGGYGSSGGKYAIAYLEEFEKMSVAEAMEVEYLDTRQTVESVIATLNKLTGCAEKKDDVDASMGLSPYFNNIAANIQKRN